MCGARAPRARYPLKMRTNPKSLADAVVNGKIQPKRTKAMDMRFIGCMTENVNNNSEYIGDQEN